MFDLGLKGKRPKEKYHSYKGDIGKKADNIINRDFKALNQIKNGPLTYRSLTFLGANVTYRLY